jgi:hypothetical protein
VQPRGPMRVADRVARVLAGGVRLRRVGRRPVVWPRGARCPRRA